MLTDPAISIFMPAFDAGRHIEATIGRVPDRVWANLRTLWIINDGSRDDTSTVAHRLALTRPSIRVIDFPENRGYGPAVRKGLEQCREDGCDIAVCLHADGQYAPEYIPAFVDKMQGEGFDLLQGSRIASGTALSGGMPLYKFLANRALTFFENIVFGLHMTDYHSGYLVYGRRALDTLPFERFSNSFDFDLEVIAAARAGGLKIGEIPIPTRYADEISHVRSVRYGLRVVGVMVRYWRGGYHPQS